MTAVDDLVLRGFTSDQVDNLVAFFSALPEGDRTFVKEPVTDRAVVASWSEPGRSGSRWIATEKSDGSGSEVVGYVAVLPLPGWSSHVGELRLVVAPTARGKGVGAALAQHALAAAVDMGLSKLVVEVVAVQEGTIRMFNTLGFRGEALLTDQIRDGHGDLQDLVVLAHDVQAAATALETVGADLEANA